MQQGHFSGPVRTLSLLGRLLNAGFLEARKFLQYDCFIFHDVDLLPENDKIRYQCGKGPRHLSVAVDKFNYTLPYKNLVGGASAFTEDQYRRVNGYSNSYWGWGKSITGCARS